MTKELLSVHKLTHRFHTHTALHDLTFTLPKHQMIGIVGPDGAGKTTLLRLIAALLLPTTGSLQVLGYNSVKEAEIIHTLTGYMPQRFGLYEDLSVQENLDLYSALRGLENEARDETFDKLLSFTGLAPFTKRLAGALSGGMKQKLGLACALIKKPTLLILDEPSVGVDPISRRELWQMVCSLIDEGVSVLWSTTYLDEAQKCSQVVLLNEGHLLHVGDPAALTKRVEGRVFRVEDPSISRRHHLEELEQDPEVVDVAIQGKDLRIVAKSANFPLGEPIDPRFEDAFIDLLGGHKKEESKLVQVAPMSKQDGDPVIAKNLLRKFGTFTAVGGVSFSVKRGEIFGLLGPNGAGKSTIFKMLCGLLSPTEGKAIVGGVDIQKAPAAARTRIGYMAQKFSLYGNLSVVQNLSFFQGVYGSEKVDITLDLFDLTEQKNILCDELPLGIKQRVALAAAIAHWPDILFLDEPTSGMDPVSRRHFWSQMNSLVKTGKTILVSTHFMDEAENCDRIALIYRGLIIHLGTPDELKEIVKTTKLQNPTLEDAFAQLIQEYDEKHPANGREKSTQ